MRDASRPDDLPETAPIQFHFEEVQLDLPPVEKLQTWIQEIITRENCRLVALQFIFCNDEYLYRINVQYLNHDTFTDIITFPYQDPPMLEGDIFISAERVRENAASYEVPFAEELLRVISHGIFHLCGYDDKTGEAKKQMTQKEEEALRLWRQL